MKDFPKVGVGVAIIKGDKVLLGKRKSIYGNGEWAFPGGKLEFKEKIEDCAKREVFEETGLIIKNLREGPFTSNLFNEESAHYVTLFIVAEYDSGEPEARELEKCEKWEWFEWNNLPTPLFRTIKQVMKKGFNPFKLLHFKDSQVKPTQQQNL